MTKLKVTIYGGEYTMAMIRVLDKTIRAAYNLYGSKILTVRKNYAIVEIPKQIESPIIIIRGWYANLQRNYWWAESEAYFDYEKDALGRPAF